MFDKRTFNTEVVELHRHPFAVGIVQPETKAAKRGSQVGHVKLTLRSLIGLQNIVHTHPLRMIHHVLQREEPGDVRLGLFNCAVKLL